MKKKYYAFADHETIQAMLHSLFRFQSMEQAQLITNRMATEFILAPKLSDPLDKKSFVLWVRDLLITDEEKKQGYLGNFGRITIHKLPKDKWTLTLTKLEVKLNKHPQRKAVPRANPNMGHPVLRSASRNKTWPSMQAANADLMKMHEEFPAISVPGVNRLRIMTYIKQTEKGVSPIQRLELNVVKKDEGVYVITIKNLTEERQKKRPLLQPQDDDAPAQVVVDMQGQPAAPKSESADKPAKPEGFYTNLVSKGRKKKKK